MLTYDLESQNILDNIFKIQVLLLPVACSETWSTTGRRYFCEWDVGSCLRQFGKV